MTDVRETSDAPEDVQAGVETTYMNGARHAMYVAWGVVLLSAVCGLLARQAAIMVYLLLILPHLSH